MPSQNFDALARRFPDLPALMVGRSSPPRYCLISGARTNIRLPNGESYWPDYVAEWLADGILDANFNFTPKAVEAGIWGRPAEWAVPVGLEEWSEGAIAWFPTVPGCFVARKTAIEALRGVADALNAFNQWRRRHGDKSPLLPETGDALGKPRPFAVIEERAQATAIDAIEINAIFDVDFAAVTAEDLQRALRWLEFSRADLFRALRAVPANLWASRPMPDAWSVGEIVQHIATADHFYTCCWDETAAIDSHDDHPPLVRLALVREQVREFLRPRAMDARVGEWSGELWTLRKLLRRLIWHERVHTRQIRRVTSQLGVGREASPAKSSKNKRRSRRAKQSRNAAARSRNRGE